MMNKDMVLHQVDENMSNLTSASGEQAATSVSSGNRTETTASNFNYNINPQIQNQQHKQEQELCFVPQKKKRNQPGNPDPESEVIALSPKTLMATNRFICEICNKGFQRDQNLQLHRRGHNLPWKLKQRSLNKDVIIKKKVYICPETSCVHHNPARALGDLTGIKKHFFRKHGEKKWKCEKCSKRYAVQSDWKAHFKTCGTKEYKCDCGTLFSRRDSFITHRAFCDALAEESSRSNPNFIQSSSSKSDLKDHMKQESHQNIDHYTSITSHQHQHHQNIPSWLTPNPNPNPGLIPNPGLSSNSGLYPFATTSSNFNQFSAAMSATALLQKAAQMGSTKSTSLPQVTSSSSNNMTTMGALMTSAESNGFSFQEYMYGSNGGDEMFNNSFGMFMRSSTNGGGGGAQASSTVVVAGDGGGGGGEEVTRDFLGLRTLMSQNEILNLAALGNCLNNSTTSDQHQHSQGN